jgi:hypothetical protein
MVLDDISKLFIDHSKTAVSLPDLYESQDLSKQWLELLIDGQGRSNLFNKTKIYFHNLENQLVYEYVDCINTDLLSTTSDEIENFYNSIFRHMYKAIQPLDYFSTELIAYIGTMTHLAKWPVLVRVNFSK